MDFTAPRIAKKVAQRRLARPELLPRGNTQVTSIQPPRPFSPHSPSGSTLNSHYDRGRLAKRTFGRRFDEKLQEEACKYMLKGHA